MSGSPVGSKACFCLPTWIRVEGNVRYRLYFGNAPPLVPKTLRYEPKRGSVVSSHFGSCAEDEEERGCMKDVKPFIPLYTEYAPRRSTPVAGCFLLDGAERYSGHVSAFAVVHTLPTDIRIIQGGIFAPHNLRYDNGDEHG